MASDCPPYEAPAPIAPASILEYAARASDAANHYRDVMERRADLRTTFRAARALADITDALCTAIADAVAAGDGQIAEPSAMDKWRAGNGPRPGTKPGYW